MLASLVMPTVSVLPLMLRAMVSLMAPMVRVLPLMVSVDGAARVLQVMVWRMVLLVRVGAATADGGAGDADGGGPG